MKFNFNTLIKEELNENSIKKLINKTNKSLAKRGPIDYSYLFKGGKYGGGHFGGGGSGFNGFSSEPEFETVKDTLYIPITRTFNQAFAEAKKDTINPTFIFNKKEYNKEEGNNPDNVKAGNKRTEVIGLIPVEYEKQVEKKNYGGSLNNPNKKIFKKYIKLINRYK